MSVSGVVVSEHNASPELQDAPGRARARFDEFVSLGKQAVASAQLWVRIGRLAAQMDKDHDYTTLGYSSMGACIMEIELLSGYDRSSIYAFKALYEEASPNAGDDILAMPLGSAQIYRQLPSAMQRDPEVRTAAQAKPKDFRVRLAKEYPQALIESKIRLSLSLDESAYRLWEEYLDWCRETNGDPAMTYEQCFELCLLAPAIEEMRNASKADQGC